MAMLTGPYRQPSLEKCLNHEKCQFLPEMKEPQNDILSEGKTNAK